MTLWWAAVIGVGIGFTGGLLGKGGSAIATPLLHAIGVPAIIAVAAPLPATIPSTLVASWAYWRERLLDWRVVRWSIGFGVPATAVGAYSTRWISGGVLVAVTDVVLIALGIRLLLATRRPPTASSRRAEPDRRVLALLATGVGLASGLLANGGGFLLAPLFVTVLRLPIKTALACSLAVAAALAVPGTLVHAALGHVDWQLVVVFGSTSVPLSFAGARVAMRTDPHRLERIYGMALIALGAAFLFLD